MPTARAVIEFYETSSGKCPAADFLNSLSDVERAAMEAKLDMLLEHGLSLPRPHAGTLRDHINELRAKAQRTQLRLLYFVYERNTFVICNGFIKKGDRVRDSEINKAIEYRQDYLEKVAGDK